MAKRTAVLCLGCRKVLARGLYSMSQGYTYGFHGEGFCSQKCGYDFAVAETRKHGGQGLLICT